MKAPDYISGLDEPTEAPETAESLFLEAMRDHYGFKDEDVLRCLAEVESYAKQPRRT